MYEVKKTIELNLNPCKMLESSLSLPSKNYKW